MKCQCYTAKDSASTLGHVQTVGTLPVPPCMHAGGAKSNGSMQMQTNQAIFALAMIDADSEVTRHLIRGMLIGGD